MAGAAVVSSPSSWAGNGESDAPVFLPGCPGHFLLSLVGGGAWWLRAPIAES